MEPAQKRQRCEMSAMQRLGLLPREVQAKILAWAMEPTPSAALVKTAIGKRYGNDAWWATKLGRDRGYQRFLNYHTPCLRLWARTLEALHDGSLAWKWSQTNVFLNRAGHAHVRGGWKDLVNEMAVRRDIPRKPPVDKFLHEGALKNRYNQLDRRLYVNVPEPGVPDDAPQLFECTYNCVRLEDLENSRCWPDWCLSRTRWCRFLYDLAVNPEMYRRLCVNNF